MSHVYSHVTYIDLIFQSCCENFLGIHAGNNSINICYTSLQPPIVSLKQFFVLAIHYGLLITIYVIIRTETRLIISDWHCQFRVQTNAISDLECQCTLLGFQTFRLMANGRETDHERKIVSIEMVSNRCRKNIIYKIKSIREMAVECMIYGTKYQIAAICKYMPGDYQAAKECKQTFKVLSDTTKKRAPDRLQR